MLHIQMRRLIIHLKTEVIRCRVHEKLGYDLFEKVLVLNKLSVSANLVTFCIQWWSQGLKPQKHYPMSGLQTKPLSKLSHAEACLFCESK